jgi:transposase
VGNAKSFMAFLNQMRLNFPGKRLLIILDNSSVHKNKRVKAFLKRHPEMRLFCLPTYSPEYNPVEKIWWWLKPKIYLITNEIQLIAGASWASGA